MSILSVDLVKLTLVFGDLNFYEDDTETILHVKILA